MRFPPEISSHIASFIADEVRATDPQCYRSARSLQAAWRGWLTRTHILWKLYDLYHNMCERCDANVCTQIVYPAADDPVWTCDACSATHLERLDWDAISIFPASYTEPSINGDHGPWQFVD